MQDSGPPSQTTYVSAEFLRATGNQQLDTQFATENLEFIINLGAKLRRREEIQIGSVNVVHEHTDNQWTGDAVGHNLQDCLAF